MYNTVAKSLFEFREIGALPIPLKKRIEMMSSPDKLSAILIERHAGFHKTCTALYNKQKLERKRKIFDKQISSEEKNLEPTKKMTRQSIELQNFSNSCFFCEKTNEQELHECQSIQASNRVQRMAETVGDLKILGKLSEGDMIATEAKYHSRCYLDLFNRHRKHNRNTLVDSNGGEFEFLEGITHFFNSIHILST